MIAAPPPPSGLQRGRGGFLRGANDAPWVSDPAGGVVKSGPRRGLAKMVAYGSPSSRGKLIEDSTPLTRWAERRVVLGVGVDPALVEACRALLTHEIDGDEFKAAADEVVARAKDAAKTGLAADRGSHGHALTEDDDSGEDWLVRVERGEALGLDHATQAAIVAAWRGMLERHAIEVLAVEASCVDDEWRLAGTLDRIVRLGTAITFARPDGAVVTVPAGTVVVLDVKTGRRRTGRDGSILYWQSYSIQVASYAQSRPYDTATDERGEWPWPIDQTHGLIAHIDIDAALTGSEACCHLVHVDLVAGREHGGATVTAAKLWGARSDIFATVVDGDPIAVPAAALPSEAPPSAGPTGNEPAEPESAVGTAPIAAGDDPASIPGGSDVGGTGTPSSPLGGAVSPTPSEQQEVMRAGRPDEGATVSDADFEPLQRHYGALDAAGRGWIGGLVEESIRGGRSFHAAGCRTLRRWHLIRGLVLLAERGETDTDALRELLSSIIGERVTWESVTTGQLLGSLGVEDAARFAGLVDGRLALLVTTDGTMTTTEWEMT